MVLSVSAIWTWGGLNWDYMYMESGYLVHCVNILTLIAIFLTKPTMLMWSPYMHLYVSLIINIVTSGNHYMYVEGDCPKNIDPTTPPDPVGSCTPHQPCLASDGMLC